MPESSAPTGPAPGAVADAAVLALLLDRAPLAVLLLEPDGAGERIVAANAHCAQLLGRSPAWLEGRSCAGLLREPRPGEEAGAEARLLCADGATLDCVCWRVALEGGRSAVYLLPVADPAAARVRPAAQPAEADRLAGFSSPGILHDLLARDWSVGQRDGRSVSVLLFDVDAARAYREVFGRQAAESVVRQVGRTIAATLRRSSDVVARTGDDEFTALCVAMQPERALAHAEGMLERIRALALHHPRAPGGRLVTCSAGVVTAVPPRGLPPEAILGAARAALLQAKALGGNRVVTGALQGSD